MANAEPSDDHVVAPPRGTRPRNRRELIRSAAGSLFAEKGYSQVSIGEIAAAVNVTPSALYKHYAGKSGLLFEVVDNALDTFTAVVADAEGRDLESTARVLAEMALEHRHVGALWQRESRHLPGPDRAQLRGKVRRAVTDLARIIVAHRPDLEQDQAELLAASAIDAMTSVAFHHIVLPHPEFVSLLAELGIRIVSFEPNDRSPAAPPVQRRGAELTRREQLLEAAVELFARRGFASVSLDDIGASVGIAGPSIYHHFDSKQDLLLQTLIRGNEELAEHLQAALSLGDGDGQGLRHLSDAYVDLAIDHSAVMATLITESRHLDEISGRRTRQIQRDFIDSWVELAREDGRSEPVAATRIKVQAAQMMANTHGLTPYLHAVPGFRQTVRELAWAIQA
jgi:AcrR family transcriptional regulator